MRVLLLVRIPCFIWKPCLSLPPVILKMYPLNCSPRTSPSTSWPSLLSKKGRLHKESVSSANRTRYFSCADRSWGRYLHVLFIFNINFLLATSCGIANVKLRKKYVRAERLCNSLPSSLKKGVRDPYFGKYNKLACKHSLLNQPTLIFI